MRSLMAFFPLTQTASTNTSENTSYKKIQVAAEKLSFFFFLRVQPGFAFDFCLTDTKDGEQREFFILPRLRFVFRCPGASFEPVGRPSSFKLTSFGRGCPQAHFFSPATFDLFLSALFFSCLGMFAHLQKSRQLKNDHLAVFVSCYSWFTVFLLVSATVTTIAAAA